MSMISIAPQALDLTGRSFGRLKAMWPAKRVKASSGASAIHWLCGCQCGKLSLIVASDLVRADGTRSCGCLNKEHASKMGKSWLKHGLSGNYLMDAWEGMIARCGDQDHAAYENYGGRGIAVCSRWIDGEAGKSGFECFADDMGERPSDGHSLDRRKNEKGYYKENCRWATQVEQMRNTRSNLIVTAFGKTACLAEFTGGAGTKYYNMVWQRIKAGWNVELALTKKKK